MATGFIQIWPGTPVTAPIFSGVANAEHRGVSGVRLADQGVDKLGAPAGGFMPGMDVRAQLTVVGDGPVGASRPAARRALWPAPRATRIANGPWA